MFFRFYVGTYGTHPEDIIKPPNYRPAFELQPRAVAGHLYYDVDELAYEWETADIGDAFLTVHVPYFKSYLKLDDEALTYLENTKKLAEAMDTDYKTIFVRGAESAYDVIKILSNVEKHAGPVPAPKLGVYRGSADDYLKALRRFRYNYPAVDWGDVYSYFEAEGFYDRKTLITLSTKFAYNNILASTKRDKVVFYLTPFSVYAGRKSRLTYSRNSLEYSALTVEEQMALSIAVALLAQKRLVSKGYEPIEKVAFIYIGKDKKEKRPEVIHDIASKIPLIYNIVERHLKRYGKLYTYKLTKEVIEATAEEEEEIPVLYY